MGVKPEFEIEKYVGKKVLAKIFPCSRIFEIKILRMSKGRTFVKIEYIVPKLGVEWREVSDITILDEVEG